MTPPLIKPVTDLTWPVYGLELLTALSVNFQQRVQVSNPADARNYVHIMAEEVSAQKFGALARPAAVISRGMFSLRRTTGYQLRPESGGNKLELLLTDFDRFPQSQSMQARKASFYDFAEFAGHVMQDIADAQNLDCNLSIDGLSTQEGPLFTHPKYQVDPETNYWLIFIDVSVAKL